MKKVLYLLFLLGVSFHVMSQPYQQTLRGTVIDVDSKQPIPGATVLLANENLGTMTDSLGYFKIPNIPLGRHTVIVTLIGYNELVLADIMLTAGKEVVLTIPIKEKVITLSEATVVASKGKDKVQNEMATVSARSFTVEETERYAGSLGDPSRMAKNFAGISTGNDQRNDIIIRGNSPLGLLWRLDGFDIPNPNHYGAMGSTGGAISMLNNNLLSNSDFFTGAFPAEYGNAMSGVFDLKMRNGNNEKHEHVAQVGFNGFELGTEGPIIKSSKASYLINYRYSMLGLFKLMGFSFGKKNSTPEYQDLSYKISIPLKHGYISLIGIGGIDRMLVNKTTKRDTIKNYMGVAGISAVLFLGKKSRLECKSSIQYSRSINNEHRLGVTDQLFAPDYISDFNERAYTFSVNEKTKINARNTIGFGVTVSNSSVNFCDSSYETSENYPYSKYWQVLRNTTGTMNRLTAYAQWQHYFSDVFSCNSGINYQYLDYNNSYSIEPRLGFKATITEKQTISTGFGAHSRVQPTIVYLTQNKDTANKTLPQNKNLGFSKSVHAILGYDLRLSSCLRLKSELYYQHLYNIPISTSQPQQSLINYGADFEIFIPENMINSAKGKNYGLEITLEKFLKNNYYFLFTGSFFQSKYSDYSGIERNTAFNNNFIMNGLFGYELPVGKTKQNSAFLNCRGTYAGGNPKVEIDLIKSQQQNKTVYDWEHAYEKRYPAYIRFDLRLGYKINRKNITHEFAVDLQNITAHENVLNESYDKQTQSIETVYQYSFFPMALYRLNF